MNYGCSLWIKDDMEIKKKTLKKKVLPLHKVSANESAFRMLPEFIFLNRSLL